MEDKSYLQDGESIWLEIWLPKDTPQDIIIKLEEYGFGQTPDKGGEFYIPEGSLETFKKLAYPYDDVYILQRYIHKDIPLETRQNMTLDLIKELTQAGVHGIDNFRKKIWPTIMIK